MRSIFAFGPQGELIFIEGLTKDKSVIIRQQCAKGLGLYGPKSFRALLFGLRDIDESVQEFIFINLLLIFLKGNIKSSL